MKAKPQRLTSTIRVEPTATWPKLGDDGSGGREVKVFYEQFGGICNLANNGESIPDTEMPATLEICASGSRNALHWKVLIGLRVSETWKTLLFSYSFWGPPGWLATKDSSLGAWMDPNTQTGAFCPRLPPPRPPHTGMESFGEVACVRTLKK